MIQALHKLGLTDRALAVLTCCSRSTIWHIRMGHQSGRNIQPRLQCIVQARIHNERLAGLRD
jgi:hypothetical protein